MKEKRKKVEVTLYITIDPSGERRDSAKTIEEGTTALMAAAKRRRLRRFKKPKMFPGNNVDRQFLIIENGITMRYVMAFDIVRHSLLGRIDLVGTE